MIAGLVGSLLSVVPVKADTGLIFADCSNYINIRTEPTVESDIVGKIFDGCAATVIEGADKREGWIKIKSGNAVGYVRAEYFAFDEEAKNIAEEVAYNTARIYPEALTIRSAPSIDAEPIGMAYAGEELEVVAYEGDWMTVALGNGVYGFVNAYYVEYNTYYGTAETAEEEQARLDREWLAYLAAQEAEEERLNQQWIEYLAAQEAAQKQAEIEWMKAVGLLPTDVSTAPENSSDNSNQSVTENFENSYNETPTTENVQNSYEESTPETEAKVEDLQPSYSDSTYSSTGQSIVDYAVQFVGNPYVWGGTSLTGGTDCSGFTQSVFANFGIYLPRTAAQQSYSGTAVSLDNIQAGDLLFYRDPGGIGHVTIYMGNGQVVHASNPTDGIIISSYGYRTPVSARRYF